MASLKAPPTLAQVATEHYDRELQVAPSEREIRRRDLEHAAVVERQQALAQLAPGVAVAWQLTRGLRLPAIPLHPRTLEPVGQAITDELEVLEHWQVNMAHAVGIRLGVHRGGAVALVGVKAQTRAAWRDWVQTSATVEAVRPWSDEDPRRGERVRDLRPLGGPMFVLWTAPAGPPIKAFSAKGDRQLRERVAWWRQVNTPEDRGGFLCWTVAPADGRLPVLRPHQLAAGLEVLGSDDVLPLSAATPDRWRLQQSGSIREPGPARDCPRWLLERFGAKWAAA